MPLLLLWLAGGTAAVYVGAKIIGAVFGGEELGPRVRRTSEDAERIFKLSPGQERFMDPMYDCFGQHVSPDAISTGEYKPSGGFGYVPADLWSVAVVGPNAEPPTNVPPYTITPNNFGLGGRFWMHSFGDYIPWPEGDQFPFNAVNEIDVNSYAWGVGYEYLAGVKNTANDRVAAMRARVTAHAATRGKPQFLTVQNSPIDFIAFASAKNMTAISTSIVDTLKNKTNFPELAEKAGVSQAKIEELANSVVEKTKTAISNTELVSEAAKYVTPVANTLNAAVKSAINGDPAEVVVLEGIKAAAGWIPIYGQIIAFAAGLLESKIMSDAASAKAACQETMLSIVDLQKSTADSKLLYPWHALEIFSATTCSGGGNATPDQHALQEIFTFNIHTVSGTSAGEGLVLDDRVYAQRWWATAAMFMSDARVFDIFDALGVDIYGGTVASDEQVMLVAAPIALANGLTQIDDFAKRLWARSNGWRDASEGSRVYKAFNPDVCPMVRNAWWLQWAALARDAFELADELRGRTSPRDALGDPDTLPWVNIGIAPGAGSLISGGALDAAAHAYATSGIDGTLPPAATKDPDVIMPFIPWKKP